MDRSLVFGAAVVLFCVRDARLLAARRRLFAPYFPMLLAAAAGCGLLAETLSASEARDIIVDPRFWVPAAAIHAALSFRSGRRSHLGKPPDWLSVMPGPVLCVAMVGAGRFALANLADTTGLTVGLALGSAHGTVVALVATSRLLGGNPSESLRFASIAHVSALLLVPALAAPDRPLAIQPVDWPATVLVIGSVLLLLGLSVALHRMRQR